MVQESTWEDLDNKFREARNGICLQAKWFAYLGSEDYGIWRLCPEGPETDEARATFSLLAAKAIEKLGIAPIQVPKTVEHCPHWGEYCAAEKDLARRVGSAVDFSEAIPHGLEKVDWDAVDPCGRAWLESLRREGLGFRLENGEEGIGGKRYQTRSGLIYDVCRASAVYCKRLAREEIRRRLAIRLKFETVEQSAPGTALAVDPQRSDGPMPVKPASNSSTLAAGAEATDVSRHRGPRSDDEGHVRVAEILAEHPNWSEDLKRACALLAQPSDGKPGPQISAAWAKDYSITGYSQVHEAISDENIEKHILRRLNLGKNLLAGNSRKLSETLENSWPPE